MTRYAKMICALVGAVCTWAVTYFPDNHTVQVAVGLATALVTVATVYLVPNVPPTGKPRRADMSEQGYGLVELLIAVLLVIVILWVLLALVGR